MMCFQRALPHIVDKHRVLELHRRLSVRHNDEFPILHRTGDQKLEMCEKPVEVFRLLGRPQDQVRFLMALHRACRPFFALTQIF